MAAPLARKRRLRLERVPARRPLALGADVALAEADLKQVSEARLVIRVLLEEGADGDRLRHGANLLGWLPYVKGIHSSFAANDLQVRSRQAMFLCV